MSKAIKQILIIGAVIAISMVFVIQFRPGTNVDVSGGPGCALEISGECISQDHFIAAFRLTAPNVDGEIIKQMRLRKQVVDGLVERWALLKDAERLQITVSDDELTKAMAKGVARFSLPVAQEESYTFLLARYMPGQVIPSPDGPARRMLVLNPKTGKFDYERYGRWVAGTTKLTVKSFRAFQRDETIAARVRALVRSRVRVSEAEAYAVFARSNERVVAEFVKLERSFYSDYVIDRSTKALDKWAEANQGDVDQSWESRKESYLPECRRARHILIRIDDTNPDPKAAEKKAEEQMEAVKKRLDNGEAFAKVARDVSGDPRTAPDGGSLGCFAAGKLAKPNTTKAIDDAAFALKAGKVSEVIKSNHGLHLVKLDKIADEKAAEKIGKREVKLELYLRSEAERMAAEASKQILAAVQGGKSLEDAVKVHLDAVLPEAAEQAEGEDGALTAATDPARPKVRTSDPVTAGTAPFSQVQSPTEASKLLFDLKKDGEVAKDVIKLYDGYAVATLKERKGVDKKGWDEQRTAFMARLRRDKQRDAVAAYVQRLKDDLVKELVIKVSLDETDSDTPGG
jgi:peptidyl-prolyl cis-trans isomerase D